MRSSPKANPPCGGAPAREPLQQEAEPLLRDLLADAKQPEDPALQSGIGDAKASAAQLGAVEHEIVRQRPRPLGSRIEEMQIVGVGRGERVVDRPQRAGRGVPLEEREIHDPDEAVHALGGEIRAGCATS